MWKKHNGNRAAMDNAKKEETIMMYDKKEMRLVGFETMKKLMMRGGTAYMVLLNGSLVEVTAETDWQTLLFHNFSGGKYAVPRKKLGNIGAFDKELRIGKWGFRVSHAGKGGEDDVRI